MWYLTETCSPLDALIMEPSESENMEQVTPGQIYTLTESIQSKSIQEQWRRLSQVCCTMMEGAP